MTQIERTETEAVAGPEQAGQTGHRNPWKKLSTRVVYDNPWIRVREDQVIQPAGKPGIYGVVHFKNTAIGVIPVDDDGYIHLVGQYRYALDIYSWEIPEGGCPEGEDPLEAAARELMEETGLRAQSYTEIGRAHLSNSVCDETAIIYVAEKLSQGVAQPEDTEELAHKRVPFSEALNMVLNGEITDAISVMAITQYALKYSITKES